MRGSPGYLQSSVLLALVLFAACKGADGPAAPLPPTPSSVVQKGSRLLGLDIVNTTPSSDFNANLVKAKSVGAGFITYHVGWNQIEATTPADCVSAGTYADPGLSAFDAVVSAQNVKLVLSLVPITTSIKMMPSNLTAMAYDNPLVICRFKKMLDYVFTRIPNTELVVLLLGNEIDVHADSQAAAFWTQYWNFYADVSTYAKTLRAGLKVGISGTMSGLTGTGDNPNALEGYKALNLVSDLIGVNYYPINHSDFSVLSPSVIVPKFDELVTVYNGASYVNKGIHVQEIGYQSGSAFTGSSDALQAQFMVEVFKAWDKHAARISSLSFLRLNDVSAASASDTATAYGFPMGSPLRPNFIEYIQTLGLRTYGGADKPAFTALRDETAKRGW